MQRHRSSSKTKSDFIPIILITKSLTKTHHQQQQQQNLLSKKINDIKPQRIRFRRFQRAQVDFCFLFVCQVEIIDYNLRKSLVDFQLNEPSFIFPFYTCFSFH